jgi:hypothetical protein
LKVEIFDPAMCCSSGLCGPGIDPVLIRVNEAVLTLQKQGIEVTRFNLSQQPKEFMANRKIADLLREKGKKALPVILINGRILKSGEYPSYEGMCKALNIEPLEKGRPMTLTTDE